MERRPLPPLPPHRVDGTLPPASGLPGQPPSIATLSPYLVTLETLLDRLTTTRDRVQLARGLIALRSRLRALGIVQGFHWIGGSFVRIDADPRDIDVITFHVRPAAWVSDAARDAALASAPDLFELGRAREAYGCDARFVDLSNPVGAMRWGAYWSFLLGIDKDSYAASPEAPRRVGFLQLALAAPDQDRSALQHLEARARALGA